jgi:hypothetical protein
MTKSILALGFVAALSLPLAARANLITGVLNATGTITLTLDGITFIDNELFINSPASAQQGGFTSLAGTMGGIDNITNPPDTTGALDVADFITFAAAPNISITLTYLFPGIDGSAGCSASPPAASQVCTPDLPDQSPLDLQNTSSASSVVSFDILGVEVDSLTGDTIPITGEFTMPLTNENFQELLDTTLGGGTVITSFSAQFTTSSVTTGTVPEPGNLILMLAGIGVMGLAWLRSSRFTARQ